MPEGRLVERVARCLERVRTELVVSLFMFADWVDDSTGHGGEQAAVDSNSRSLPAAGGLRRGLTEVERVHERRRAPVELSVGEQANRHRRQRLGLEGGRSVAPFDRSREC